jgi:hypothetical protein
MQEVMQDITHRIAAKKCWKKERYCMVLPWKNYHDREDYCKF